VVSNGRNKLGETAVFSGAVFRMGNVSPDASAHLVTRSGKIDSGNRKLFSGLLLWDCRRIIDGTKPIYLTVVLPAILPQLLSGFRIGIAFKSVSSRNASSPMIKVPIMTTSVFKVRLACMMR